MGKMNVPETLGALTAHVQNVVEQVERLNDKMDTVLSFQAKTEERLIAGNKKFEEHERKIKEVEDRAEVIGIKSNSLPRAGKVYALIIGGFTILAFLVSVIALQQ